MSNPEDQLRQAIVDEEHLKLLGIAYLVSAAMNAFFSVFGLFYAGMGVLFTTVLARAPSGPGPEPPPEFRHTSSSSLFVSRSQPLTENFSLQYFCPGGFEPTISIHIAAFMSPCSM
jgi:hypothetical protein